jgi:hypothetical protein
MSAKKQQKLINPMKPKITLIIVNKSVLTQKKIQSITTAKINWILLFKELIAVDSELLIVKAGRTLLPLGFKGLILLNVNHQLQLFSLTVQ